MKKLPADGKEGEDNFTITPNHGDNALVWQVVMKGPAKYQVGEEERACPYAGREFTALLTFPDNYPFKNPSVGVEDTPWLAAGRACVVSSLSFADSSLCVCRRAALRCVPQIVFQDIPYHPGIVPEGKEAGEVCERAISDFWAPTRKAVDFLNHIYTLLANPSAGAFASLALLRGTVLAVHACLHASLLPQHLLTTCTHPCRCCPNRAPHLTCRRGLDERPSGREDADRYRRI